MTQLTITKMNSKPYTGSYGLTNKVGILTVEYGEKWLNGFVNNVNFGVGSKIFAEVEEKGEFLNFRVKGIDLPKTQNYAPTAIVAPNLTTPIKTPEVNWDRIEDYNNGKTDSMREQGAKRTAGDYTNLMLELKFITPEQWNETFNKKANEIYNTKLVPFS